MYIKCGGWFSGIRVRTKDCTVNPELQFAFGVQLGREAEFGLQFWSTLKFQISFNIGLLSRT